MRRGSQAAQIAPDPLMPMGPRKPQSSARWRKSARLRGGGRSQTMRNRFHRVGTHRYQPVRQLLSLPSIFFAGRAVSLVASFSPAAPQGHTAAHWQGSSTMNWPCIPAGIVTSLWADIRILSTVPVKIQAITAMWHSDPLLRIRSTPGAA